MNSIVARYEKEEMLSHVNVHKVQAAWKKRALIDNPTYLKWYDESVRNPDAFWVEHGKRHDWFKAYMKVKQESARPLLDI